MHEQLPSGAGAFFVLAPISDSDFTLCATFSWSDLRFRNSGFRGGTQLFHDRAAVCDQDPCAAHATGAGATSFASAAGWCSDYENTILKALVTIADKLMAIATSTISGELILTHFARQSQKNCICSLNSELAKLH